MKLQPLSDHLVVKAEPKAEITKSGIVIPDTAAKERPERGEVIAVGPGKTLENGTVRPLAVKVGDKVLFKKYGPDEVKLDGETLLVLDEADLIALIVE